MSTISRLRFFTTTFPTVASLKNMVSSFVNVHVYIFETLSSFETICLFQTPYCFKALCASKVLHPLEALYSLKTTCDS